MNGCLNGNNSLWILIILLILGSNVLSSRLFSGCGWPFALAGAYCLGKNGTTLGSLVNGLGGCGCNN